MTVGMDPIESAATQLDSALSRLEDAVESLMERAGDPAVTRRELDAMVDDRDRLANELDNSLARERELQKLADEASEALGAAIDEVRAALEREAG